MMLYAAAVFNNPHSHLLAALAVHYGIKEVPFRLFDNWLALKC